MGKDKIRRFAEIDTFKNVMQLDAGKPYQGKWATDFFKNNNPWCWSWPAAKANTRLTWRSYFPG
jgi:tRNA (guanine-N7-)-methyltransferase